MDFIKWFIGLFAPNSFENQPYFWLLNQFGHMTLGFLISWLIAPVVAFGFIVVWEVWQYLKSKDLKDGIEDILFVSFGILNFLALSKEVTLITLGLLVFRLFQKYYKL